MYVIGVDRCSIGFNFQSRSCG